MIVPRSFLVAAFFAAVCSFIVAPRGYAFDHRKHLELKAVTRCAACHVDGEAADHVRPGKEGHATCDAADCHAGDFSPAGYAASTLCTDCHLKKSRIADPQNLKPFPVSGKASMFAVDFNHQIHLLKGKKDLKDGCRSCHLAGGEQKKSGPAEHGACAKCHDAKSALPMTACEKCHRLSNGENALEKRSFAGGACRVTEKFKHEQHAFDERKKQRVPVTCDACHLSVAKATTLADLVLTQGQATMLKACGKCHKAGEKKKDGRELFATIGDCTRCHIAECITGGPAPAWHQ